MKTKKVSQKSAAKANRIDLTDFTAQKKSLLFGIKTVLRKAMKDLHLQSTRLSLSIVGDVEMKKLNWKYRRKRKSTDVLSFSQNQFEADPFHLGDIIICAPQVKRQAGSSPNEIKTEFAMLSIHGLLHLMGYDHEKPKEEKVMFTLQNKLLTRALKK